MQQQGVGGIVESKVEGNFLMKNKMMVTFTVAGMLFSWLTYAEEKTDYLYHKEAAEIIFQGKIIHKSKNFLRVIYKKRLFECKHDIMNGILNCRALKE